MKFTEYCEWISQRRGMLVLLAEKLDVGITNLYLWKNGKTRIPVWYFRTIQEVTHHDVTIEELVDEQSELHKHKGRRSLSGQKGPKPRELPRALGRDKPGTERVRVSDPQERELSGLHSEPAWEVQEDGKTHPLPTHHVDGSRTERTLPKSVSRVLDGIRKTQSASMGETSKGSSKG